MTLYAKRESDNTSARYVALTWCDQSGNQVLAGSANPMVTEGLASLRLNEGRGFVLGAVYPFSAPLAADASIDIAIAWPSGVNPQIHISGLCAGDAMGYLYEGSTVTGGTSITPLQMNRSSTTASQAVALLNPTVSSLGTKLLEQILIGGQGKKASGGDSGTADMVLKGLTTYLFRLTNVNGTDHAAEMVLEWFE